MDDLYIEGTKSTPIVDLKTSGIFSFIGKTYPENIGSFYAPILKWIRTYLKDNKNNIDLSLDMTYINSGSSKILFTIFSLFEDVNDTCDIKISWIYDEDNEVGLEYGEGFQEDFSKLNIKLIVKN